jgi:hypothetical protein
MTQLTSRRRWLCDAEQEAVRLRRVRTLDDILRRMQAHQTKKRAMLRPLQIAHSVLADLSDSQDADGSELEQATS